jgi:hypothetical protein
MKKKKKKRRRREEEKKTSLTTMNDVRWNEKKEEILLRDLICVLCYIYNRLWRVEGC